MATYEHVNFAQAEPNTPIHEGETGNVYIKCNLTNCRVPDGSTVTKCQRSQRINWMDTVEYTVGPHTRTREQPQTAWVGAGVFGEVSAEKVAAKAAELGVSE